MECNHSCNCCEILCADAIEKHNESISNQTVRIKLLEYELEQINKKNEELKKKLWEAVDIIELVDYQFCTSFGDAENIRNSVNKARDYLKGVKGEF